MKDESTKIFLLNLIGSVYKILPMNDMKDETLPQYIDSLYIQLVGGAENFSELKNNQNYTSIVNVIQYFRLHDFDSKTCRREVLKCTNLLEKISKL